MSLVAEVFLEALVITGFVLVMMLLIEYINVQTQGLWLRALQGRPWNQYLIAAVLGATPGCLGAFAVVALFAHGGVSVGALVAAMIATSGDEAFVMLAMMPGPALILTGILILVGLVAGPVTDILLSRSGGTLRKLCGHLSVHPAEKCECFPGRRIFSQWLHPSLSRVTLTTLLVLFLAGVVSGLLGPPEWDWKRITVLGATFAATFVVATVPDHFLKAHLWQHIARRHSFQILGWTFGALLITHIATASLDLTGLIASNRIAVILFAAIIGIIPESGPHLLFVTLYAKAVLPFSVLLVSSIVQDGHGMLPLLGQSRRTFLVVKSINLLVGLLVGFIVLAAGW